MNFEILPERDPAEFFRREDWEMVNRNFKKVARFYYPGCEYVDVSLGVDTIREGCQKINRNFEALDTFFDLEFQYINVGSEPGDCTGDTVPEARQKINHDFALFGRWVESTRRKPSEFARFRCWLGLLKPR